MCEAVLSPAPLKPNDDALYLPTSKTIAQLSVQAGPFLYARLDCSSPVVTFYFY